MRIGVISDTHGFLDPKIPGLFGGVEHILHAGDIGYASIILELEQIAPVTVVLGNNDYGMTFRETEFVSLAGKRFMLQHIVPPCQPDEALRNRLWKERVDVLVFGHSHQRHAKVFDEVLFFNPGYAGKPKLGLTRSAAILEIDDDRVEHRFLDL